MWPPVFTLIKTVAFDVQLADVDAFTLRLELFQDETDDRRFKVGVWRTEFFRIQSTFPQAESTGEPEHHPSDEVILVDWSHNLAGHYSDFKAENPDAALNAVLEDFRHWLRHTLG
jgi:hypothetical protein